MSITDSLWLKVRHPLPSLFVLLALVVCVFEASPSAAQQAPENLQFVPPTNDIRVDRADIGDITQDRNGFLWFGIRSPLGGLARFDAYGLKVYNSDNADPTSLVHDAVWVLEVDVDGNIWAGTVVGGLSRYNSNTDDFTQFIHDPDDPTSLPNNDVKSLFSSADGTLWIGTTGGLAQFDAETETFTSFFTASDDDEAQPAMAVRSIAEDPETGHLWLGTRRNGVIEFDPGNQEQRSFVHDPDDPTSLSNNAVDAVIRDQSGRLWFGTRDGLNLFDPTTSTFTRYLNDPADPTSIGASRVWSMLEDRSGRVWVGHNDGLDLFDVESGTFTHMPTREAAGPGIPVAGVRTIFEDQAGAIWVGSSNGGVSRLSSIPQNFTALRHDPEDSTALSSNTVHSLTADQEGGVWVITAAGIDYFDGAKFTRHSHDPDQPEAWPSQMRHALVDDDNNLWIGTASGGLTYYETDSGAFQHYALPAPGDADMVTPIGIDLNGDLWLASAGHGYVSFDGDSFTYLLDNGHENFDATAYSEAFYLDAETGELWLGATLIRLGSSGGELTAFPATSDESSRLEGYAEVILPQADGRLMIGGYGEVSTFDRETLTFDEPVGVSSGLPDGWYQAIEVDEVGQYWILSTQSIGRYDPVTGVATSFDSLDGLPLPHYTDLVKGADGTFYVSSNTDGVAAFAPSRFSNNPIAPPVVLTGMELFNEPISPGGGSPLSEAIHETGRVDLNHDQNFIAFTFSALNYDAADKNQFRYMLEGFDDDWLIAAPDRRLASYTGLPPGDYTFRVQASNNSGVWNEDGVALSVVVSPPWWRTTLAYLAYVLAASALLYGFVRWRTSAVKRRNRALEERLAERQLAQEEKDVLLEALGERVQQIEGIMNTVPTGIVLLDGAQRVVSSNRVAEADLLILTSMESDRQLSHLGGVPVEQMLYGDDAEEWREIAVGKEDTRRCFVVTARQIEADSGIPREPSWVLAWQDVTAERELQAQAITQQRLADVGQFATGIAHDMNNLLSVIAMNGNRLHSSGELTEASDKRVTRIIEQTGRAAAVLRQILDYSRRETIDYLVLDASEEIRLFLPALRETVPTSVHLGFSGGAANRYWIEGDSSHLQQIVLNLVLNASDAGATSVDLELSEVAAAENESDSRSIRFVVRDDGTGIEPADANRIFDPFFSTKPFGKGTGLGLAQVEGLVKSHGGTIDLESTPGEGSSFVMHFPASEKPIEAEVEEVEEPEVSFARGSDQTVLVVDDNEDLLEMFVEVLADAGYEVASAQRGEHALAHWQSRGAEIDLILSDYMMPDMHGGQLINDLHDAGSDVPVILISGLQDGASSIVDLRAKGLVDWIRKPIDAKELLEKVDRALAVPHSPQQGEKPSSLG